MKRANFAFGVGLILLTATLVGCAESPSMPADATEPTAPAESAQTDQMATLIDVDAATAPSGVNVDSLFTIEEAREILGMSDVFIAVPAG